MGNPIASGLQGAAAGAQLGSIIPGVGNLVGAGLGGLAGLIGGGGDDEAALEQLKRNQQLYGQLQTPEFKQYNPAMAKATTISEDPSLRSAQLGALNRMAGLADKGLSDVDQAGFEHAREMGDQMAHSGIDSALQDAEARHVGGSGLEYALRAQASQAGAQRAQQGGLDQAAQGAQMRALYNQAYGNALSGVRGQDFTANSRNADILNNFNMANTQQQNYAQQYNNDIAQRQYEDQYQKTAGMAGANTGMAQGEAAKDAANQGAWNSAVATAGQVGMGMYGKQSQGGGSPAPAAGGGGYTLGANTDFGVSSPDQLRKMYG